MATLLCMVAGAEMFVAVILCLLSLTEAGVGDWPFGTNFQFWLWQSGKALKGLPSSLAYEDLTLPAVVVDQWLYIEGGEYYTDQGNGVGWNPRKFPLRTVLPVAGH
jgi:hypothetical protein